jgi:hypothetical protein
MEIQGWSVQRVLKDLDITEVPFDPELLETTEDGYIQNREIAVNHSESRRGSKRSLGYGARSTPAVRPTSPISCSPFAMTPSGSCATDW